MYSLQCIKRNNPFAILSMDDVHAAPTRDQKMMMDAVAAGLAKGLFYTRELQAFIEKEIAEELPSDMFMDEEYLQRSIQTEGGPLGMDIYYCRQAVESIIQKNVNRLTLKALIKDGHIKIGAKLKGKLYASPKTFTTSTVESFNCSDGSITFLGTGRGYRGSYRFTLGANDTRVVSLIDKSIQDSGMKEEKNGDFRTITIDPSKTIQQNQKQQYFEMG
jgi:hypothetical protein